MEKKYKAYFCGKELICKEAVELLNFVSEVCLMAGKFDAICALLQRIIIIEDNNKQ